MNAKSSVLLVFGFASLSCFFSQAAQAQTVNVTIQDNSGAVCALPTAAKTVLLPSTPPAPCAAYSGFSIAGIGAGARVT
ncbi:MAG: hypothetical protein Q8S75_11100, partial [Nitrospirota bacterium]|nr:hypothetical protein [Nitrospirota bacterium]